MAKVIVIYTARIKEFIDWPDDEIQYLTDDGLQVNLEPSQHEVLDDLEIESVIVDGREFETPRS